MPLAQWQHRLKLSDLLDNDDPTREQVGEVARQVHQRLEDFRLTYFGKDDVLDQISDEFHTIGYVDRDDADLIEFNMVLDDLYDWADRDKRLWID